MKHYAIWNKKDPILTPVGEVFTPEQWVSRYPIAGLETVTVVCSAGEINGGFFGTLGMMVQTAEAQGCDFSACTTDEEKLETIEAFENAKATEAAEKAAASAESAKVNKELTATSLASIAASMEYQNMLTLEDTEEV